MAVPSPAINSSISPFCLEVCIANRIAHSTPMEKLIALKMEIGGNKLIQNELNNNRAVIAAQE
jgi:hypothetical protein